MIKTNLLSDTHYLIKDEKETLAVLLVGAGSSDITDKLEVILSNILLEDVKILSDFTVTNEFSFRIVCSFEAYATTPYNGVITLTKINVY